MDGGLSGWHPPGVIFFRPSTFLPTWGLVVVVWLATPMGLMVLESLGKGVICL